MAHLSTAPYAKPYDTRAWQAQSMSWASPCPAYGRRVSDVTLEGVGSHTSFLGHVSGWETPSKQRQRIHCARGSSSRPQTPSTPPSGSRRRSLSSAGTRHSKHKNPVQMLPGSSSSQASTRASTASSSRKSRESAPATWLSKDGGFGTGGMRHEHTQDFTDTRLSGSASMPCLFEPRVRSSKRREKNGVSTQCNFEPLPRDERYQCHRNRPASRG